MSEEAIFFRQAAEAIVATSLNAADLDPTIKELLSRIKYVNPNLQGNRRFQDPEHAVSERTSTTNDRTPVNSGHSSTSTRENTGGLMEDTNNQLLEYFGGQLNSTISGVNSEPFVGAVNVGNESEFGSKPKKHSKNDKTNPVQGHENATDEKKYPCAKCNLIFRRSSDLRRHERTHLPVLPNICSQCGKGFARKDALKRHCNTLTCKRNRNKLLSIGGDINEILERARQTGTGV